MNIDTKLNLCDTCKFHVAECDAEFNEDDLFFGDGIGNDNVYECKVYEKEIK